MSNVKIEISPMTVKAGNREYTFYDWEIKEDDATVWGSRHETTVAAVSAAQSWASQNCDSDRAEVRFVNRG